LFLSKKDDVLTLDHGICDKFLYFSQSRPHSRGTFCANARTHQSKGFHQSFIPAWKITSPDAGKSYRNGVTITEDFPVCQKPDASMPATDIDATLKTGLISRDADTEITLRRYRLDEHL